MQKEDNFYLWVSILSGKTSLLEFQIGQFIHWYHLCTHLVNRMTKDNGQAWLIKGWHKVSFSMPLIVEK